MSNLFLYILSISLALGSLSPGANTSINLTYVIGALFIASVFLKYPNSLLKIKTPVVSLLLLIISLFISHSLYGINSSFIDGINVKLLICIIFFWALSVFFENNPNQIHRSLLIYSLTCAVYAILIFTIFNNLGITHKGRLIINGENPNSTSARLAIGFIYLLIFSHQNPFNLKKIRAIIFLFSFPIIILIAQSGSRGSLAGLIICLLLYSFHNKSISKKNKLKLFIFTITSLSSLIFYIFYDDDLRRRWTITFTDGDSAGRDDIWDGAFSIFQSNPILGVGEFGYVQEITKVLTYYIDPHNLFIYLLAAGGILALIIFTTFLIPLCKNIKVSNDNNDLTPALLFTFTILMAIKTGGVITYLLMWFIFSIVYSYKNLHVIKINER